MTSTTVAWPFSDFFQNFPKSLETSKKRCLTVGRRSRDLRPLSRDRSATFFKIFPNHLKRPKNVVWQSADGRVTSTTVAWPFSDFFQNFPKSLETSKKRCLTVGRQSRDLRQLSRDRSATFFKKISNCLKRPKNVVWQSADGRVTSNTVAWPFSDFFQNFPKSLESPKNVVWQSADSRVTSDNCHVTVQRLFSKKFLIAWNVQKNVVWQSADGRVTSNTVAWPFSDFFQNFPKSLETSKKTLFDSRPTVAWSPTTVAWPFSDFFQNFPKSLETSKNVVWQSAEGRVTFDHCHVTVQRLFSKKFLIAWNVEKSLFDSRPMVAWPPTTLARPHILPRRCISRSFYYYY